ncbi:sigma-54-dependent Fis family transcriptional regulator [Acidiphilium sp. AL]|uniref:Sigma-54-dependent Fis family transcriptional regulator n=1 Tax=Acidiphilium iwatense TaxID=768198 RepID=A0ABS9DZ59_9PROT|nr:MULTISPECIES: sigma-54-dependent Fis family transcriptional regulator [Acidiphilium]MCF3948047.1 sigma-54-dependent Fis family transcriptional regulator [Acidiphilium iwatense]MCU4161189.1 sigma-54-dependent Fis family transcriptional regulator [Acidiphilium sp. AL]
MLPQRETVARLSQARALMERDRAIPPGLVPAAIAESWRRCIAVGLDPRHPPKIARLSATALNRSRAAHETVYHLARAEMQALHRQLGAHSFVLAFAAPDGVLLDTLMVPSCRADIEAFGIIPGTLWHEDKQGTNALGTAMTNSQRIAVRGAEHFFADHNRLSCIAAPIFGPDHTLAGVLDASCTAAAYAPHARAMVALAAAQIEAHLFRITHAGQRVLTLHGRTEFLDTAYAALLAIDEGDRVIAANDQARFMLAGLPEPTGAPLSALFEPGSATASRGLIIMLTDRTGRVFRAKSDGTRLGGTRARGVASTRPAPHQRAPGEPVADDPTTRAALDMAGRAALRGMPVLIRGETGTGKEVAARYAHHASGRSGKFVAMNCGAIPPDLLAAELFGHAEGAFTGARRGGAQGLAAEADGGTLFLDEIADLPPGVQVALLRFLDDFSVRPLGGGAPRVVDALLLAATNANLAGAVAEGRFRADLYYRLAIVEILLPPLRERTDFAALARTLLAALDPALHLSDAAITCLARHSWPGNIRELRNMLSRLALTGPDHIDEDAVAALLVQTSSEPVMEHSALRDLQTRQITDAVRVAGGNVSAAARRLGVSRNTIYRALDRNPGSAMRR